MRSIIWLVLMIACLLSACRQAVPNPAGQHSEEKRHTEPGRLVIPESHAYAGAYIDFGEREDAVTLEKIERFDKLVQSKQAIIAFSNDWGNQSFPGKPLTIISNYGAVPLVYWSPWDRPVETDATVGTGRFALDAILSGKWDDYIDMWAEQARMYGKPLFVSWGLEMNGNWFPWSGIFYGGGHRTGTCNDCFEGPETYKKVYRYVVDRVKAKGASNILWVWHANNTSDPDEPWNAMARYYPGPQYVDWLALSAYGTQYANEDWISVDAAVAIHYRTLCRVDETKPIMLAEWGVGEFPKLGSKAGWISEFFDRLPKDFPRIRAAVFWHERWQNGDQSYSNLRVNSSSEALQAYRRGIADPFWLSRPEFD